MTKKVKGNLVIAALLILILSIPMIGVGMGVRFYGRIFPGVKIGPLTLGGLRLSEAAEYLDSYLDSYQGIEIGVITDDKTEIFQLAFEAIGLKYDSERSVNKAYMKGRSGKPGEDILTILKLSRKPEIMSLECEYELEKLNKIVEAINEQVAIRAVEPTVILSGDQVTVNRGRPGKEINRERLIKIILDRLEMMDFGLIKVDLDKVDPSINEQEADALKARAEKIKGKELVLENTNKQINYSGKILVGWLNPRGGYRDEEIVVSIGEAAKEINREAQNPTFVFSDGRVKEFAPAKEGIKIKEEELMRQIYEALGKLENEEIDEMIIAIPVTTTPPEFETADVNNLGINKLIGRGSSRFRGSISERIHNLNLAAARLNGILVKPGETFSFNREVGEITKETGYKEAYIIKDNQTILDDGGGVCQVSTTLFRAVLNAGLPVIERRAHAYRVYYYEQDARPGLDATVYAPTTDLKFRNDTGGHILMQTETDIKNLKLTIEIYGTDDGRGATITKPVITDQTPPPEDIYIDDPALPMGQIKQTEHASWGAVVTFDYWVEREGETIYKKRFISNYKPWGNVFLRGTGAEN